MLVVGATSKDDFLVSVRFSVTAAMTSLVTS